MSIQGDHAVVIGASVGGLPTAKVLSERFAKVTVIERDPLPETAEHRRGVPQSPHLHGLLYGGRMTLDEIFGDEGFTRGMRDAGAPYFDFAQHQAFRFPEGWIKRSPGNLMIVFATRWGMEHVVRTLATDVANITFKHATATDLVMSADGSRVVGVRTAGDDGEEVVEADLVVDACGRASKTPKWLAAHGYEPPVESVVRSYLGYATVYGHLPEDAWPGDVRSLAAPPFPGTTRGGFVVPQENGLVGLMAAGQSRDYPPSDPEGFGEFLRTSICPLMHEMWQQLEPVTEIRTTRTSHNRLRRWHELERRPERFIAVGDATCAFNPVYGQGITTAALQAKALRGALAERDDLDEVVRDFPDQAMSACQFAWSAATDADIAFDGTDVENLKVEETDPKVAAYFSKLRLATTLDAEVARAFFTAQGNMRGDLLFAPELVELVERVTDDANVPDPELNPPAWSEGGMVVGS